MMTSVTHPTEPAAAAVAAAAAAAAALAAKHTSLPWWCAQAGCVAIHGNFGTIHQFYRGGSA